MFSLYLLSFLLSVHIDRVNMMGEVAEIIGIKYHIKRGVILEVESPP